ncbi:phage major capsid protein [Cyanobium sp. N.Huapi 1H5]|uniref:phage major capsid protein n=1 Tax=Cyanobium sp. N.Huapi 1H5 TaxID=2823719 RepID=UPI0020CCB159|nr:phage major capsid protein [Cyanobium sp. N.Huapi 1H5]MCP9838358.1 phage major capsid protein [Cyanobium sp. N.Huapi 1H5]
MRETLNAFRASGCSNHSLWNTWEHACCSDSIGRENGRKGRVLMAVDSLIAPPAYSMEGLLRSLEDIHHDGYESRIAQTMSEHGLDAQHMPAWKYSRAIALPDNRLVRALTATTSGAAGADATVGALAEVAQAARPATVLEALGVPRREIGGAAALEFPIVDPFTIGGWQGENVAGPKLNPTIKSAMASPRMAIAHVEFSRNLRLQANRGEAEQDILQMLRDAAGATVERGFLQGTGSQNQPAGLMTVQGRGSRTFAGATPTRTELVNMVTDFTAQEGRIDRAAWLMTSAMAVALMNTEAPATSGRYLLEVDANGTPRVLGIRVGVSNHALAGRIMLFQPENCRIVFWGPAFALADKYSLDTSGGTRLVVYNTCDVVATLPLQIIIGGQ